MRSLIIALLVLVPLGPGIVHAQANAEDVYCEFCRDPIQYPDDYVNFAFNLVYGEDAWMDLDQADDFFIVNANGERVYVDIDFVMHSFRVAGFELPVWPQNMLQITLALPDGTIYTAIRSIFQTPLPVPSSQEPEATDPDHVNEGGDEGVDESENAPGEEPDEPEWGPIGTTGIQDPDENGDFPDPDWCEEC